MVERSFVEKGYVGETYVIAKLIRDFNVVSVRVPQQFFSYDLITSNNKRLEVKTSMLQDFPRKWKNGRYETSHSYGWQFRRNPRQMRERTSHFVICICFQSEDFSKEPRCFVIPTEALRSHSEVFKIFANPTKGRRKFWEYENKWDLIAEE